MSAASLRAEVLLLVRLAERHLDGCEIGGGRAIVESVATDALIEHDGDAEVIEEGFVDVGSSLLHEFEGALAAAEATNLLSRERLGWLRDLADRFAAQAGDAELTAEQVAGADAVLKRFADEPERGLHAALEALRRVGGPNQELLRRWERFGYGDNEGRVFGEGPEPLMHLKAVLPGRPADGDRRAKLVLCFDGGVVVHTERRREIPEELRDWASGSKPKQFLEWLRSSYDKPVVSDDAGTPYETTDGGGGGRREQDRWVSEMRSTFTPGVPRDATTLTVDLAGERFEFDVTGVADLEGT